MHELLQALFPYLVFFYLLDCVSYVRRGKLLFTSEWGRSFVLRRSGFCLVGFLPTSRAVSAKPVSSIATTRGLYTLASAAQAGESSAYQQANFTFKKHEDVSSVKTEGDAVLVDGCNAFSGSSPDEAARFAMLVRTLQTHRSDERRPILRAFEIRRFDISSS